MPFGRLREFFIPLLWIIALTVSGIGCSGSVYDKIDAYLRKMTKAEEFAGVVLVADGHQIIFQQPYGLANREKNIPYTVDIRFKIGALTEQFTAAAIFQLADEGRLALDSPVTVYLPDYPAETGDRVTIRHLLTHTSGISNYTLESLIQIYNERDVSPSDILATFKDKPLNGEPGERYAYSVSGYQLLGAIIEAVSGQTYENYLTDHLFSPLGMSSTEIPKGYPIPQGYAVGYFRNEIRKVSRTQTIPPSVVYSAGALGSTIGDLYRWTEGLFDDKVLSSKARETMFAMVGDTSVFGWQRQIRDGRTIYRGLGRTFGFVNLIERGVDDSLTVIVVSNFIQAPVDEITAQITDLVLEKR